MKRIIITEQQLQVIQNSENTPQIITNPAQAINLEDYSFDEVVPILWKMNAYKYTEGYISFDLSNRINFWSEEPSFGGTYYTHNDVLKALDQIRVKESKNKTKKIKK